MLKNKEKTILNSIKYQTYDMSKSKRFNNFYYFTGNNKVAKYKNRSIKT